MALERDSPDANAEAAGRRGRKEKEQGEKKE